MSNEVLFALWIEHAFLRHQVIVETLKKIVFAIRQLCNKDKKKEEEEDEEEEES